MYLADVNSTSFHGSLTQMLIKSIIGLVVWEALAVEMPSV